MQNRTIIGQVIGSGVLALVLGAPASAGLTWTVVADNTSGSGTRSLRGLALSDDDSSLYGGYIQGSSSAGVTYWVLAGDPPTGTLTGFWDVTDSSNGPSSSNHQAEAVATDSRGILYAASIKDSTSGDNARVFVFEGNLSANSIFPLADIDFAGTTGERVGDLAIREDGGTIQLYVTRFHPSNAWVERYVVGGTGAGDATLTLDATFNGTGRYMVAGATHLRGIDVAADGTIFIASRENDLVYRVAADLASVTTAAVVSAMDVALHTNGRAYVTRYAGASSEVVELNQADLAATGTTYTATGTFPHDFAGTGYAGIDIDATGRLYVSDQFYLDDVDRVLVSSPLPGGSCPEDLDGDSNVGFTDLNILLGQWGPCVGCDSDLDDDDNVGFTDLNLLLGVWGPCT